MTKKELEGRLALAVNLAAETKKVLETVRQKLDDQGVTSSDTLFDLSDRIMSGELSDIDDIMEELEDSGSLDDMEEGEVFIMMNKKMYEELKNAVWDNGVEAIDDLLGYEHDVEEDSDVTENRMDEALDQMPEEDALEFYNKYCK